MEDSSQTPRRSSRPVQPRVIADLGIDEPKKRRSIPASGGKTTKKQKTSESASEQVPVETGKTDWVACDKCNKWRIVNPAILAKYEGTPFHCGGIPGCDCSQEDDEIRFPTPEMIEARINEISKEDPVVTVSAAKTLPTPSSPKITQRPIPAISQRSSYLETSPRSVTQPVLPIGSIPSPRSLLQAAATKLEKSPSSHIVPVSPKKVEGTSPRNFWQQPAVAQSPRPIPQWNHQESPRNNATVQSPSTKYHHESPKHSLEKAPTASPVKVNLSTEKSFGLSPIKAVIESPKNAVSSPRAKNPFELN
jgi:CW-type Zinc Finger